MKFGSVPKFDKGNKTTSKEPEDKFISKKCDVNVIFLIYGQFGAT